MNPKDRIERLTWIIETRKTMIESAIAERKRYVDLVTKTTFYISDLNRLNGMDQAEIDNLKEKGGDKKMAVCSKCKKPQKGRLHSSGVCKTCREVPEKKLATRKRVSKKK